MNYEYYIHYWEVVDGDTIRILLDKGFEETKWISCRLLGVDAPETQYLSQRKAALRVKEVALKWLLEAEGVLYRSWSEVSRGYRYPLWEDEPFSCMSKLKYVSLGHKKDKYGRRLGNICESDNKAYDLNTGNLLNVGNTLSEYLLKSKLVKPYKKGPRGWTKQELEDIYHIAGSILDNS